MLKQHLQTTHKKYIIYVGLKKIMFSFPYNTVKSEIYEKFLFRYTKSLKVVYI